MGRSTDPELKRQSASGEERVNHILALLEHLMIPETDNLESLRCEPGVANCVARIFGVLRSVAFDDDAMMQTNEVYDVGAYGSLSAPFGLRQASVAQDAPERGLRCGGAAAEIARLRSRALRNRPV